MSVVETIAGLYTSRGGMAYVGEPVSQLEHALQTAHLAVREEASHELVVAALLHDIGHLLHADSDQAPAMGRDLRHEEIGTQWMQQHFHSAVVALIRMHVAAKRYLATVDRCYVKRLSTASLLSLSLQGGTMTHAEVRDFEESPHSIDATRLRLWDDQAKVPGLEVPLFDRYLPSIERALLIRARR